LSLHAHEAIERYDAQRPAIHTSPSISAGDGRRRSLDTVTARFPDVELLAQRPDIARRITDALALLEPEDALRSCCEWSAKFPWTTRRPSWNLPVWNRAAADARACLLVNAYFVLPRRARGIV